MERTILFIADPHLGIDPVIAQSGSQASLEEILNRTKCLEKLELVVVLGDLTLDDALESRYAEEVHRQFDRFGATVMYIPGNHEMGNHLNANRVEPLLTRERFEHYQKHHTPTPWRHDVGDVRILGVNNLIAGSGFPEEAAQYEWLLSQLKAARREADYVVLVMHVPPYLSRPQESEESDYYWTVPHQPRLKLLGSIARTPPDLMLAGHVHREVHPYCNLCRYQTLASPSFQANTIWSINNDRVPRGYADSNDLSFYTLTIGKSTKRFERHILDHQDRYS